MLAGSLAVFSALPTSRAGAEGETRFDVAVYGGTPSGIMAAIAAAEEGARSALILGDSPLGGVMANGLGASDIGNPAAIGGLARRYFGRVGQAYGTATPQWGFEPHVAKAILTSMLAEAGVTVLAEGALTRVKKNGARLMAVDLTNGTSVAADAFVDASYEGDLMAAAGVSHVWGREARTEFNEPLAGFGVFPVVRKISPFDEGNSLLPEVLPPIMAETGAADARVMAYNFRLCVTNDPSIRVPFPKPNVYDPDRYKLKLRMIAEETRFSPGFPIPAQKFDLNGGGLFDTDNINGSWAYPGGSREARRAIVQSHFDYQAGLLHFMANDSRLPAAYRDRVNEYGLSADEFVDNDHWPRQLYVREARRMRGRLVMTQADIQSEREKPDVIGLGTYTLDVHFVHRMAGPDDTIVLEGTLGKGAPIEVRSYHIPFRALLPVESEAENLVVSVCVSATHVALSSLRMEPQYMIMGEAAGTACAMMVRSKTGVSATIDPGALTERLKARQVVLFL